jgi:hypothetical protein
MYFNVSLIIIINRYFSAGTLEHPCSQYDLVNVLVLSDENYLNINCLVWRDP